mmetsp:Transcript_9731/g.36195  ORF Transcript_9731/g.36195 Transcript_9731/m.36195 type:complete len:537 (+) Transcript_9731:189-1799(+)
MPSKHSRHHHAAGQWISSPPAADLPMSPSLSLSDDDDHALSFENEMEMPFQEGKVTSSSSRKRKSRGGEERVTSRGNENAGTSLDRERSYRGGAVVQTEARRQQSHHEDADEKVQDRASGHRNNCTTTATDPQFPPQDGENVTTTNILAAAASSQIENNDESQYLTLYDRNAPVPLTTFYSTYIVLRQRQQQVIQEEASRPDLFRNINKFALSAADVQPLNIFDRIDQYITAELKRTEQNDVKFDGIRFSELERILGMNRANVPKAEDLKEEQEKNGLISCTKLGRMLNGKILPRKEKNYLTRKMREMKMVENERDVNPGTIVCQVAIFHPDKNIKQQEFMVLGTQHLTELKDVFYCLYDHVLKGKETRSGYFFIEDTFYVDMRQDDSVDYSKAVLEWTKQLPKSSPFHEKSYNVQRMEHTSFLDLNIKVGERYLYCHQGDCNHYIIFTEVRFWHEHLDERNEFMYPYRIFQAKMKRKKCYVCNVNCAEWVTYNDVRSPTDPTFYCEECFRQFHYDEDGNLRTTDYNFEAYRYNHE